VGTRTSSWCSDGDPEAHAGGRGAARSRSGAGSFRSLVQRPQVRPRQQPAGSRAIISPDAYRPLPTATGATTREGLRIQLPQLSIDLPIVDGDGFNAPLNKAAHYPGLSWPGEGGRSVIYAHARPGMFGPLFNAKVGESVQITSDSGDTRRYTIREYYAHWPISDLRWLQKSDHEQLVLVTCTTYNYNDPRIVVVAEPG
jgi:LPXTG-site transpeptidase (sortase) family protein